MICKMETLRQAQRDKSNTNCFILQCQAKFVEAYYLIQKINENI